MRYCIFFALLTSTYFYANAQDTILVHPTDLDSLEERIERNTKKDTLLVHLLTDYANMCFYDLDYLSGLRAAKEARSIAKEINYKKGEGLYFNSRAIFHRKNELISAYYKIRANGILNQYTTLGVFGSYSIKNGARDQEKETILINLKSALVSFIAAGDSATTANIHWELAQQYQDDNGQKDLSPQSKAAETAKQQRRETDECGNGAKQRL
jgi:hypothetical protein